MDTNVKTDPEFESMINELIENPQNVITIPYAMMIDFIYCLYLAGYRDLPRQLIDVAVDEYGIKVYTDLYKAPERLIKEKLEKLKQQSNNN